MIIAALLGALTFGACVDSQESESVKAIRDAKTEQLKSIATLNNAKAQAEATIAAAQAALLQAQAQQAAAEAAALNATTEAQKILNQVAAAEAAAKIANIEAQMELDMLAYEKALLDAQIAFAATADAHMKALYDAYTQDLKDLKDAQATLAAAQATLAEAEKGLASVEETFNKTVASKNESLVKAQTSLAAKEAELAAVKELSEYDMTKAQMEAYVANFYEKTWLPLKKKESLAIEALSATVEAISKYETDSAYAEAFAEFITLGGSVLPSAAATDSYNHDGNNNTPGIPAIGFVANDQFVPLFYGSTYASSDARVFGANIDHKGRVEGVDADYDATYHYTPIVYNNNIVAANVAKYEAVAKANISATYDAALENAANNVALAKDAFEKKVEGVSDEIKMKNIVADYEKVYEKYVEIATDAAEAEYTVETLATFIDENDIEADSEIEDADDYDGSYTYATYKSYFNKAVKALQALEAAEAWLEDGLDSDNKDMKKFMDSLKTGVDENEDYTYEGDTLVEILDELGDSFDNEGNYILPDYYAEAIEAQANLQDAYEDAVGLAEEAVEYLNTMVAEAENWTALAITKYNELYAANVAAAVAKDAATLAAAEAEAKCDAITALLDSATAYDSEYVYGEQIASISSDIATLKATIKTLEAEIKALTLEKETASAEDAIAVAQEAVVDAEYQVAVAEANLANTKAALDAALAE